MAANDKNILIVPNIGSSTADPKIVFSGADASTGAQNITLQVYPTNSGTLSFEGSAGQLFSITNSMSGTIYSVNDVSGIPSIEVLDTGLVKLAQYSGNVLLGTGTDNGTDKLQVNGSILGTTVKGTTLTSTIATGTAPLTVSSTTTVSNLSADMLDGLHLHTGRNNEANKVVRTDANGYIQAGWINTDSGDNGTTAISRVYASNDGYLRYYTLANFAAQVSSYITGGATLSNDTSTNSNAFYPAMAYNSTSGAWTTAYLSSSKFYFNPSTGTLNATIFNSLSDENQKTSIVPITNALATVNQLSGFEFDWLEGGDHSAGVIAQKLEKTLPFLVKTAENGEKSVNYSGLIAYLIESVKELSSEVDRLKNK